MNKNIILLIIGLFVIAGPFLSLEVLSSKRLMGLPMILVYIFGFWLVYILLTALISKKL